MYIYSSTKFNVSAAKNHDKYKLNLNYITLQMSNKKLSYTKSMSTFTLYMNK